MSKKFESMTQEELSQFMKANPDSPDWQKAYNVFASRSEWQEIPEGTSEQEEFRIIGEFISQVV